MEIKPKLNYILVDYKSSKEPNQEYSTKREFNESLSPRPLPSINSIYIQYELNLKIEQSDSQHTWHVYKEDKFIFSFTYKDEKDFIDRFEERLKQEMGNQPPGPPAEVSMD